jgi:signal transduction histidine kinase
VAMKFFNALPDRITSPRRVKFVLAALLCVFLSLILFYGIGLCPKLLPSLAKLNGDYALYVRLTNAFLALVCAAFLLWPREGAKLVGGWNDYVGAALLSFFVQYGLRSIGLVLESYLDPDSARWVRRVLLVLVFVISTLNNLLIFAAARILLNKKRRLVATHPSLFRLLEHKYVQRLKVALPPWCWIMFPVSFLGLLAEVRSLSPYFVWTRLPDAVFSVYCLSWFGYALYLSFYVRGKKTLARMAFLFVLAYGAGQLVYAGNPFLAEAMISKPAITAWSQDRLGIKDAVTVEFFEKALETLDGALFAVLAPMKYLLFLPAFILYLLSIISVNDFREALSATTSKRKDYLSRDGILSVVGNSLDADEVKLLIRMPGVASHEQLGEMVLDETWTAACSPIERCIYPIKDRPLLMKAMITEGEISVFTSEDADGSISELGTNVGRPQTLALIPVRFHGGVIGVLWVVFRGFGKYNDGTLEKLRFMSELIAPSVQDFRTIAAVEKLGLCFNQAQLENPTESFEKACERIVWTLYYLLNPLGIALTVEWGFRSIELTSAKGSNYYKILQRQKPNPGTTAFEETNRGRVRIETDQLSGITEKGETYYMGSLRLEIPNNKDDFAQPTLAAYSSNRQMVAALTANGISNVARKALASVVEDLGIALNQGTLSIDDWMRKIDNAIQKSGIVWSVVSLDNGHTFRGHPEKVELLATLTAAEREELLQGSLTLLRKSPLKSSSCCHILQLTLTRPEHRLFLGVKRANFGQELDFQSPWREFLEKLASVAGVALVSIEDREEAEARQREEAEERIRAAQEESLKTIALISQMLMHQLVNMIKNQLDTSEYLLEILPKLSNLEDERFVTSLLAIKESAEMMQGLTSACTNITRVDRNSYCSLEEAIQQAESLFRFELTRKEIVIQKQVESGAVAKVQPKLAALALASLIGNAIEAIEAKGKIEIKVQCENGSVFCHVINNGAPIPSEIRERLFRPGISRKHGHSGWGLYLVSRSLQDYEGALSLSYSNAAATCFTLRLPTASNGADA